MAAIQIVSGEGKGQYYPLTERTIIVGRGAECDVRLRGERISRRHLQIRFDEASGVFCARDLQSANGVLINARRITRETPLDDHDLIDLGEAKLRFTLRTEDDIATVF